MPAACGPRCPMLPPQPQLLPIANRFEATQSFCPIQINHVVDDAGESTINQRASSRCPASLPTACSCNCHAIVSQLVGAAASATMSQRGGVFHGVLPEAPPSAVLEAGRDGRRRSSTFSTHSALSAATGDGEPRSRRDSDSSKSSGGLSGLLSLPFLSASKRDPAAAVFQPAVDDKRKVLPPPRLPGVWGLGLPPAWYSACLSHTRNVCGCVTLWSWLWLWLWLALLAAVGGCVAAYLGVCVAFGVMAS